LEATSAGNISLRHNGNATHASQEFHDMIGFILFLVVIGLIGGFVARALVPGRDAMSVGGTMLLGIVGSFIGGFIAYALFRADEGEGALQPSGIIGSIIGSVIALLVYRAANNRSVSHSR
jgi:uncharacterized membrane protein YeaQ/YmgE (transglycosylase-associated protein family)